MAEEDSASPAKRIYKQPDITAQYGITRSAIYREMKAGRFPLAIRLSARSIGWWKHEVDEHFAKKQPSSTPCADNPQYQSEGFLNSRPGA